MGPSAHNPALACTSSHILSTTIYGGAFCFPGRIDCIPSFGGAATHGGLVVMLLPKGGVTWKSAKAQLPPTSAISPLCCAGVKVGNGAAPSFSAETLPAGSAP